MKKVINHRFGVEIELNTFDYPSNKSDDNSEPIGSRHAAHVVKETLQENVEVTTWHTTINSNRWLVKPDSSCGFEICSPVLKGRQGLKSLVSVINSLKNDGRFNADSKCSFHVHFELPSRDVGFISSLIVNWIKCELFFFLLIPDYRKQSKYCQLMGLSDLFPNNAQLDKNIIFNKVSDYKFYSLSLYHFKKSNRNTVEFRLMDNRACLDGKLVENWIILLNRFINKSNNNYVFNQEGLLEKPFVWLDFKDVFDFLDLYKEKELIEFIKKRIKSFARNDSFFSLSLLKKIFGCYLNESIIFLENI